MFQLHPFEGGHDADVTHGGNEFDTPAVDGSSFYGVDPLVPRSLMGYAFPEPG